MVKNGESSKAMLADQQGSKQMFAAIGNFFKIQSEACLKYAGEDGDPKALADLIAGLQASGVALGADYSSKKASKPTTPQEIKAEKKRKRAEKLAAKDPNAPKRPASAYLMYQNECREEVKKSMPEGTPYAETLKKIGEMWKDLAPNLKQVYTDRANAAMGEFKTTNEAYSAEKGDVTLNGIKAAVAAQEGSDGDEDEEDEVENDAAASSSTDDDESDSDSEDEAPPPPPVKKAKKSAAEPASTPAKKDKKEKKAAAVEAPAAKKSKKEKKSSA